MTAAEWRELSMSEVMAEFYDGPHATPSPADDGPVYLGIKNITETGHLDLSDVRHIAEEDYAKWVARVEPRAGDIVFTYEATLHRYAIIPEGFRGSLGRRVALIRSDPSVADGRFLHYVFLTPQWRRTIEARINVGSTVDRIPLTEFPTYPVRLPSLPYQEAVVTVISSFDELIANSRRRMAILEEMCRLVYREWFVHLRFPGWEETHFLESDLGPLPADWDWKTLADAAQWLSGGTPSTSEPSYWNGDVAWITSGSLTSFLLIDSARKLTDAGVKAGSRMVDRDTLLFVVRGMSLATEFRHGIADARIAFGQDCKALVAKDGVDPLMLAFAIADRAEEIQQMVEFAAHGTGKLSTDRLKALSIPVPPAATQDMFVALVRPARELMSVMQRQVKVLQEARDLLLPILVSGEVGLSDLGLESVA